MELLQWMQNNVGPKQDILKSMETNELLTLLHYKWCTQKLETWAIRNGDPYHIVNYYTLSKGSQICLTPLTNYVLVGLKFIFTK